MGLACLSASASAAFADTGGAGAVSRETMDQAWWTGPLLAANASTLPQGHLYVEPYVFDTRPYAAFDRSGRAHGVAQQDEFGSLTYINYGLTDRLTLGLLPRLGYDRVATGPSSSGLGIGDVTIQGQYRLSQFQPGHWMPTVSLNLQETLPTGRFDRLSRPTDGFGAGAASTTVALYSQSLFWMPNGRILRARLDLSYVIGGRTDVEGLSVYGTPAGFQGRASDGDAAYADLAFEYSVTRHWVAALDICGERDASTRVSGLAPGEAGAPAPFVAASGIGRELILAPAVEYNWNAKVGVIVGARVIASGANETGTVSAVTALSLFF